jgi:hypothetical protein
MKRTPKPLLVPVPLSNRGRGLMNNTNCGRGAKDVEDAAHIDNECFDKTGHMRWGADYIMSEVKPFQASLKVVSIQHPSGVLLVDRAGVTWPMFLIDYVTMMFGADVRAGWTEPYWFEVCKKGARAYGIKLAT